MIGSSPGPMAIGAVSIGRGTILVRIAKKMFAAPLERAGSVCVEPWMRLDEPQMIMAPDRLPRVRELSAPASTMIMLGTVGALLRAHYTSLLDQPAPDHLENLVRQLSSGQ